jgi:hypothetical protein
MEHTTLYSYFTGMSGGADVSQREPKNYIDRMFSRNTELYYKILKKDTLTNRKTTFLDSFRIVAPPFFIF